VALCTTADAMVERALQDGPTIFKIGLTRDPMHRWANASYGYVRDGFRHMTILCATVPRWAAALETYLIERFGSRQGCRNSAPGGESTPHQAPVFVYVVTVSSEELTQWRLARVRAQG
jgi:hypothetical protein